MDKNFKQKTKDFFKKEGFFVVLFLCLCVVTMVAAVTIKKAKVQEAPEVTNDRPNQEIAMKEDEQPKNTAVPQGAEQVNKSDKENKTVASTTVKFTNPVEGVISSTYQQPKLISNQNARFINGINIEAKVGTTVKAGAEGIVEKIITKNTPGYNNDSGVTVIIKHSNGLMTKYGNLDEKVLVKENQKVTSATEIGKVGATATSLAKEQYGEFLNIQVWNGKEEVNPTKYFTTYKTKK